ncbi:hypothetical protein K435DRAFT_960573 [Dendrothele bispora CBS 962.96]|uniref:Extracellular mutant protein 11 C-terminal domain-containing protein n=1 Tax=Dendrothele bispora (strain CBS 962.96) TaxID=1314807 RepID=A0A4S8MT12_DENBC|nr:hypothetical protein K435DRAFT_960573 [Dendrothele bispora CBS 962.96]
MSARAPFVPSASRPPSRATPSRDKNAQFTPDASNPLHKSTDPPLVQKPLNVNGLIKKTSASSSANSTSRKSSSTAEARSTFRPGAQRGGGDANGKLSGSAADQPIVPNALIRSRNGNTNASTVNKNSNATSVIAPTPINAAARDASPLLRNARNTSSPSLAQGNAHIPTQDARSPSSPHSNGSFKLKMSGSTGPPQRVPFSADDSEAQSFTGSMAPPAPGLVRTSNSKRSRTQFEADNDNLQSHSPGNDPVLMDDMMMYSGQSMHDGPPPMKRYKAQPRAQGRKERKNTVDEIEEIDYIRPSLSPISPVRPGRNDLHSFSSPIDQLDSPDHGRPRERARTIHTQSDESSGLVQHMYASVNGIHPPSSTRLHSNPRQASPPFPLSLPLPLGYSTHPHGGVAGHTNTNDDGGYDSQSQASSSLDKLLGCHASLYVDDHMEKYEQMANRWKECGMDEWIKGADEIMTKYSKILDFVKDHMSKKLNLFTSFDAQVDAHNVVLGERKEVLEGVKERLLEGGGSMIQG